MFWLAQAIAACWLPPADSIPSDPRAGPGPGPGMPSDPWAGPGTGTPVRPGAPGAPGAPGVSPWQTGAAAAAATRRATTEKILEYCILIFEVVLKKGEGLN